MIHTSLAVEIKQRLEELLGLVVRAQLEELRGRTQLEVLVNIAKRNNGRIKAAEARRALVAMGLTKSVKNAPSIFHTVITRSGRFERVGPGEYRLIEYQEGSPEREKDAELQIR